MTPNEPTQQSKEDEVPRWFQVPIGLLLAAFVAPSIVGSLALALLPNEKAPISALFFGVGLSFLSLWGALICFRLITGRKVRGGLVSPRALRLTAWFFLLLPFAGLYNGYFVTHTLQALGLTVAYISTFFGLRSLASRREQNGT
jgi:hypothetical protein